MNEYLARLCYLGFLFAVGIVYEVCAAVYRYWKRKRGGKQ